jgi:hypothetical protein
MHLPMTLPVHALASAHPLAIAAEHLVSRIGGSNALGGGK